MNRSPIIGAGAGLFEHPRTILFGDCDPAKIVYFPRFFAFFHDAMEAWLTHKLAYNYAESIHTLGVGFPAVHSEADFRAPCRHGEAIVVGLRLLALGQRSFTLGYRVWGEHDCDRLRLEGKTICSSIDLREDSPTKGRALVHSEDLRARLLAFGISEWPKLD